MEQISAHKPVLLAEMLKMLAPKPDGYYLDCTFGNGGYSSAILDSCSCNLVAIDRDPNVKARAEQFANNYQGKFKFIESSFAESFDKLGGQKFDGVVMDLGVSSMQIDSPERGFSFMYDGPLDMRMNNHGMSAADFINNAEEEDIANVIYKYGDETFSRKIARKIIEQRRLEPIVTTGRLARIVRTSIGFKKGKIDLATKTFQAIRIYINDELGQLEMFLNNVQNVLADNGRLIVVSFHSLEDRIVKEFFKEYAPKIMARSKYSTRPMEEIDSQKWLTIITKKPIYPTDDEIRTNYRARSARLRAAQNMRNL